MSEVKSSKNQVAERIEVIRRTVADCLKHSVNNACTWGHEADIQFLLEQYDQLRAVAVAAKALVQTAHDYIDHDETTVEEPALTALESALEAAGYDMTDGEFCGRLAPAPESRDG